MEVLGVLFGLVSPSVAKHVGNDEAVAFSFEKGNLVVPVDGERRESMYKEQSWFAGSGRGEEVAVVIAARDFEMLEGREKGLHGSMVNTRKHKGFYSPGERDGWSIVRV